MIPGIIIGSIILLLIIFLISIYNALVNLRNMVKNQWAQIDTQLQKRFDLIPNLVETVKGYAAHEKETLDAVISARSKAVNVSGDTEAEIKANGELTQALSRLMMLSEAYPDLKANEGFVKMQADLKDIEEKIAFARQFYNDAVMSYKNKLEMFPSNVVAGMFNFKPEPFFEVEETARTVPQVKF